MIRCLTRKRHSPIGIDLGTRSVKLVQLSADHTQLLEAARWDLPLNGGAMTDEQQHELLVEAISHARDGRNFRGRDAVLCLSQRQLFLQNIRVPKSDEDALERQVHQEAAGRIPFGLEEAEIRFIEAADVRQGGAVMREVILLTCHRPVLEKTLAIVEAAGLNPVAVDVEPAALLRSNLAQLRREEDRDRRSMLVHIGYSNSIVLIAQGSDILFIKYLDVGGKHMDEAVARHLDMPLAKASVLRRHNGDRRSDQKDADVERSVQEAVRPVLDRLGNELSMCVRYHSVTFRGHALEGVSVGGGEAADPLCDALSKRLNLKCELSDPLRMFPRSGSSDRNGQWEVATGLALRDRN